MADEQLSVRFIGDASSLETASKTSVSALDNVNKSVQAADVTWKQFLGERMGSYMKQFGSHGAAIKQIAIEWNEYKNSLGGVSQATSKVSQSLSQASQKMAQGAGAMGGSIAKGANQANLAMVNLGRVLQDAPYGFIGIANNLNPLLESFQRLKAETGSTGGALKALGGSLVGGGGLGLALSAVTAAVQFAQLGFAMWARGANNAKEHASAYQQKIESLKKAFDELKDTSSADILGGAGSEFAKAVTSIESLRENVQLAKKGFIDQKEVVNQYNKELGDTIGKVKTLDEVEQQIASKGKAYLQFTLLKAAAQQALQKASEAALTAAQNTAQADITADPLIAGIGKAIKGLGDGQGLDAFNKRIDKFSTKFKTQATEADQQKNRFIDIFKQFQDEAAKISKDNNFKFDASFDPKIDNKAEKQKTSFLFDFLPFDPSGNIKPEQRGQLIDAIDKFSKEFSGIFKGVNFNAFAKNDSDKIKLALKFDADLKAGNVKFDLTKLKEATEKAIKPEDLIPVDALDKLSTLVADQYIRSFQNASEKIKNANPLNISPAFNISTDLSAQLELFKTNLQRIGAKLPETIKATNIFGDPVEVTFDQLFDTSKIANNDALKALQDAFGKIRGEIVSQKEQLNTAINDFVSSIQVEGLSTIGEAIGAALTGNNIGNVFQKFEQFLGSAVQGLGKQIIALNVAALAVKKSLKLTFANPAIGIAAGVGLVAIGAALKNLAGGGIKGFNKGGFVPGTGFGDTVPALLTPGEYVVPKNKVADFFNRNANYAAGSSVDVNVQIDGRLRGKDIVFAVNQTQKSQRRAT